jgi:hypothetical protein
MTLHIHKYGNDIKDGISRTKKFMDFLREYEITEKCTCWYCGCGNCVLVEIPDKYSSIFMLTFTFDVVKIDNRCYY